MREPMIIVASVILSVTLSTTAAAAAHPAPRPASTDCRTVEKDVSTLMETRTTSPNISAAKLLFQVGHMKCLEGYDDDANKNYAAVKKLLNSDQQRVPGSSPKP